MRRLAQTNNNNNMIITTKFNPRQKVWTMIGSDCLSKPTEVEIKRVKVLAEEPDRAHMILYSFVKTKHDNEDTEWAEGFFFETKEELIAAIYK